MNEYGAEDDFFDVLDECSPDPEIHTYDVRGFILTTNRSLDNNEIMFLSNISISGYKFYENCINFDINLNPDFIDALKPIMKLIKRSETIKNVLGNE